VSVRPPEPPPGVYSIAPHRPFLDSLAARVLEMTAARDDPLALARITILLPTRRACRALQDAFLRASGGVPLVLPRLVPLGDVEEDEPFVSDASGMQDGGDCPPAVPELRRRILLARELQTRPVGCMTPSVDQAADLAGELGRFLDQVQTERLGLDALESLVPEAYAAHWQETLGFLRVLTETWPAQLAEAEMIDPAERRNRLLAARARSWCEGPPGDPVIAAGSTGSIPATADLLATIAGLPRGYVVLPGLDRVLDEESWEALEPSHAQYGLHQLLERLGCRRADVREWPGDDATPASGPARARFVSEALRPAATTQAWHGERGMIGREALDGVVRIDAREAHEEAGAVATVLREALETPGRTAALVTPDRDLARRVAAILGRWNVTVDDSAGVPLSDTPAGTFLRLVLRVVHDAAAPVPLLALLKHPFAAHGGDPAAFRASVRALERFVLRGPRPARGFAGLRAVAARAVPRDGFEDQDAAAIARMRTLIDELEQTIAPLDDRYRRAAATLPDFLAAQVAVAEALAATDAQGGAQRLWTGEAGEALAAFVSDLMEAGAALGPVPAERYAALFDSLLAGRVVRPRFGTHLRLAILGPLEARLQRFDVTILGGLNEGTWPADADVDPWMGRAMRADYGLPAPERRIGLAAHDFAQAFCAETVVLTRAERVEGAPTMPSRWLTRLDVAGEALGLEAIAEPRRRGARYLEWWRTLDGPPESAPRVSARPRPTPPVAARPRRLSVTQIETWMRDPYAIYAREILGLRALPPLDQDADAATYGAIIHRVLDRFLAELAPGPLPADAAERLHGLGAEILAPYRNLPSVWTFWWPRFARIADWFLAVEGARRSEVVHTHTEVGGSISFDAPGGPFRLVARADRIDERADSGTAVIDFKTGAPPSKREVAAGFAPQLPLEAAILAAGGFDGVPPLPVRELAFWRLSGGREAGRVHDAADDPIAIAVEAMAGLRALVARFDDPATPYEARPRPSVAPRYSDYEHLARVREWASFDGADDGGEA
jgi:ATP-dependent helicase/nuclease subunit B